MTVSARPIGLATPLTGAAETWRIQSALPTAHPVHRATERWGEEVGRMTAGRLRIEILPGGAVVPPSELIDTMGRGILDGMATSSVYFTGRDPAFAILGDLIGGYQDRATALAFCEYGGGKERYRELSARYGVFTIGCANSGVEWSFSSEPIRGVDDIGAVEICAPEGMAATLFRKMGASPVALPPTELFTAIDEKVIDADERFSSARSPGSGAHEIACCPILHVHSLPIDEVTVDEAEWEKQPDDIEAIPETAVRDLALRINPEDMIAEREALVADRQAGVEPIARDAAQLARMRTLAAEVRTEYAQGSPMAEKAYEAHKAFLEKLGLLPKPRPKGGGGTARHRWAPVRAGGRPGRRANDELRQPGDDDPGEPGEHGYELLAVHGRGPWCPGKVEKSLTAARAAGPPPGTAPRLTAPRRPGPGSTPEAEPGSPRRPDRPASRRRRRRPRPGRGAGRRATSGAGCTGW